MNLNKDSQDIYTADSESYSGYMQENRKESKDLLSFLIKSLLVILFLVLSYFSYKIVKADLSFSELLNTDEISDDSLRVEFEEPKETIVLAVTEKEAVQLMEEVIVEEKVVEIEKPKVVEIVEEVKEEIIVERVVIKATEVITTKEPIKETTLSENYLELMAEELNSL